MKKQLLKLTLIIAVLFSATEFQAQALWTTNGTYKISTSGLDTNLYLTINVAAAAGDPLVEWQPLKDGDDETQVFSIVDHRTPASPGLMEITANITGIGTVTLCTADDSAHPTQTLTVRAGDPLSVEENAGDYTGLDQFQRRKAKVNSEGLADSAGSNPADGNNAIFLRNTQGTNSRYGVIPTAAGDFVQFDGGGIDVIQFHLVEEAVASVNTFNTEEFSITNPISNELTIKGSTSEISKVVVYSVLGNQVLSKSINNNNGDININVSSLATGLYIVELNGVSGQRLTKKIIKQ